MKSLRAFALLGVVALVGALAILLPQDRASADDDTITIRAQYDESGNVTIQREYRFPTRWVTVGVIAMDDPADGEVFQYGSMSLAVEFIPDFRLPLPPVAGFQTRFSGYLTPPQPPCEMVTYDDEDGNTITRELCRPGIRVADVTCDWGFRVVLGEYNNNITRQVLDGMWAMTTVCPHGRLLRDGELTSPSGVITIDELRAMITAALARVGETRQIDDIPIMGTEDNPFPQSETTYVDFRAVRGGDTVVVTMQARGGGAQQTLKLDRRIVVGVYSIIPRP